MRATTCPNSATTVRAQAPFPARWRSVSVTAVRDVEVPVRDWVEIDPAEPASLLGVRLVPPAVAGLPKLRLR